ncbi:MAG TPA: CCA tRNA nucleotidyltransferase [Streptosporangiaceae bacterium]|nr:CCA tRNA nucleotidyltransferase [Streptosporangiaceae bacterium]
MLRGPATAVAGLARRFAAEGHELALVGGSVRDAFLGRRHADLDLATDARPGEVRKIAAGWAESIWDTGIGFGTVGLRQGSLVCEVTTYRSEQYRPESRKPAQVAYGRSLEADLARRDFTVNAIAARLPALEIVDPSGGLRDLTAKVLRTPGRPEDSFRDDALRMLRAARFAAQLGFTVVPEVQAAMTAMAGRLPVVSPERIAAELAKLICAPGPGGPVQGISLLVDTGVAEQILPEVPRLRMEVDEHVRHKDVYQHTLAVLARAATLEAAYGLDNDLVVRLAALLHDIGKPTTRRVLPDGRVTFHHHDLAGAAMARDRLSALRFPSAVVSDVSGLVALHLRFHGYGQAGWTDSAVRRYVRDAGPLLARLHVLTKADCTTRNKAKALRLERAYDDLERRIKALSAQEELDQLRPDLNGTEIMEVLGIPPGPLVGQAKRFLLELRMEHGPLGHDRAVRELRRWAEAKGLDVPAPPATPPAEG